MSWPDHFCFFPVNGNVFIWLPCQHIGLSYGHHNALPQLYIEDHGSKVLESNSIEAMDAYRKQKLYLWYLSFIFYINNYYNALFLCFYSFSTERLFL